MYQAIQHIISRYIQLFFALPALIFIVIAHVQFDAFKTRQNGAWWLNPHGFDALSMPNKAPFGQGASIDVPAIEAQLWRLKAHAGDTLEMSATSRIYLDQVISQLPPKLDAQQRAVLVNIIVIAVNTPSGATLGDLIVRYYDLHHAQQALPKPISPEQKQRLRETYLGKRWSDQLFGQQHALYQYTQQRQRIQSDPSLTPEQKQAALSALQQPLLPSDNDKHHAADEGVD